MKAAEEYWLRCRGRRRYDIVATEVNRIIHDVERLVENIQDFGFGERCAGIKIKCSYLLCDYIVIFLTQNPQFGVRPI